MPVTFDTLTAHARHERRQMRVAVVCGTDASTVAAVRRMAADGGITPIFVGGLPPDDNALANAGHIAADDPAGAARAAIALIRKGHADVLMKGLINTDVLLHAVLDKQQGLLPQGAVLTHLAVAQLPGSDRLLCFSDAAVLTYPTPAQRRAQVSAVVTACRALGAAQPRVALVHCSEKVSDKFPITHDYRDIVAEAGNGRWGDCRIDGPLDLRTAIDPAALRQKGISSSLEGRADGLIFPDIEAANVFYKTVTYLGARVAGLLCGTSVPVVLPSRGDSAETKADSLLIAARLAKHLTTTSD